MAISTGAGITGTVGSGGAVGSGRSIYDEDYQKQKAKKEAAARAARELAEKQARLKEQNLAIINNTDEQTADPPMVDAPEITAQQPEVPQTEETAINWETMPDLQPVIDQATQQANIAKDQARKNGDRYMWDLYSLLYEPIIYSEGTPEAHTATDTYAYLTGYDEAGEPQYEYIERTRYADPERGIERTLTEIERPDFGEYGPASDPEDDEEYRGPLGGLYDAIQRRQAGPDTASAFSHAATLMGFEDRPATDTDPAQSAAEQYRSWIEEGRNTALEDMEGLSEEEEDRMERLIYSGYTADRDTANRQVENMYSQTGSYMRALQMSDEAARSIRDSRLQGEVMMMNQDFERKLMQFEAKKDQFFPLFQEGQASAQDFLANASRMMQLEVQAYTQAVGMMQLEYENEVGALQQSIENITKAAMLSIGFDEHAYNSWMAEYSTTVQPALDAFQAWLSAEQLRMGQQALDDASEPSDAENAAAFGSVFQGIAAALAAVNTIFNPTGWLGSVGALILGGLGGQK